jgi:hypothetical protein
LTRQAPDTSKNPDKTRFIFLFSPTPQISAVLVAQFSFDHRRERTYLDTWIFIKFKNIHDRDD